MATSNSVNFSMTANEIVSDSLRLLDVLGIGEDINSDDFNLGLRQLNMMVKSWQAQGLHMWTETEAIVFVEKGQRAYQLGGSGADQASEEEIKTELSAALSALDTVVTLDSSAGMAASDIIGIVQDTGTIHWDTIASVDTATQVTLATGIASAAAIDQHVYAYTSALVKPLDISSVRIENEAGNETRLRKLSRSDYFNLPNKDATGLANSFYFDRQRDFGTLNVYPVPDSGQNRLRITFQRELQDFDASTDTQDLPVEWTETIVWNLAMALSPYFGREDKAAKVSARASSLLQGLKAWDKEHSSIKIR